ncbi:hypothetical protein CANARDRAFT_27493 [[Candida] arabinofermentans NRRL YB-2248]|uniref:Transcriptional regulatory protein DEP1 n=1 Tax=[Candida] arabinofermentans NRRL YB-2248 TaxID=983967 RepID=A0A1E4T3E2_9ASCO|nr:hypothetical protein CANARDRAFT_27493 [[Candida] arabinofermentans NRRL YB-2248]
MVENTLKSSTAFKKPSVRKNSSSEISEINSSDVETDKMEDIDENSNNLDKLAKETEKRKLSLVDESEDEIETVGITPSAKRVKKETDDVEDDGDGDVDGDVDGDDDGGDEDDEEVEEEAEEEEEEEEETDQPVDEAAQKKKLEDDAKEEIRLNALEDLKVIEIEFASLKDKLYDTQLNKLEYELKLCESKKHPDFLNYLQLIEDNFQNKIEKYINLQKYKLRCLDNQTRATRVSSHQQFYKLSQDLKSGEIMNITSNWYEINKERRSMDNLTLNLPDYYQFNSNITSKNVTSQEKINDLVHKRNSLFGELGLLRSYSKYIGGLPSSLNDLKSCNGEEINEDLKELGII